jgi:hypothetical protein
MKDVPLTSVKKTIAMKAPVSATGVNHRLGNGRVREYSNCTQGIVGVRREKEWAYPMGAF